MIKNTNLRLKNKVAIVVGGGQRIGETIGNGRAVSITYAKQGAKVVVVDNNLDAAQETVHKIKENGGIGFAYQADVVVETEIAALINYVRLNFGQIDILHNNVGISIAGGDAEVTEIKSHNFDQIIALNLKSMIFACKYVLPIMREQKFGNIINISSTAVHEDYPWVSYKVSKAGVNALTEQIAIQNAKYGIRANCIEPGLMNTPMAIDSRVEAWNDSREEIIKARDAKVPLNGKMGTAWDVANSALFLASDEAKFITGITLMVDGGVHLNVGGSGKPNT
ncbi:MAG: SDR family oxidoreductase [Paracoccaceae bacterium]|jgi:NAD(P)-dependent dehydrogenase (short-subunit alcohol dehydrogenase family)|nr:SDR family oxidoreductase [Paracoccaceae bacterium]|tara:strand:+ start:1646 stop:2485 length:840 start_codon:yes stop_codon:yes gene_type:complete